jgi:hypothetical protein
MYFIRYLKRGSVNRSSPRIVMNGLLPRVAYMSTGQYSFLDSFVAGQLSVASFVGQRTTLEH